MNRFSKIVIGFVILIVALGAFFYFRYKPVSDPSWGLTFSYREAQGLGFDWKTMYLDILSDLKPKNIRLETYWDDIEKTRGQYDFSIVDEQVTEAQKQNVNVLLALGRKQPRWPECRQPDWYNSVSQPEKDQAVLNFIEATVKHFKTYSAIKEWQVENEPNFAFGADCMKLNSDLLAKEVALVHGLDSRPIMVTDSGDRGSWIGPMRSGADDFGYTLYRLSYDERYGGYYKYPLPTFFYRIRAGILMTFGKKPAKISDVELQMEPWFTNGAFNTPLAIQNALMNPKVFASNIAYAKQTGASDHYLWGVEWWYWMAKKNNDWGMWNSAKQLFANTN